MVWIDSDTVYVQHPKHDDVNVDNFNLKLINQLTHEVIRFENLTNVSDSPTIYSFEIDASNLEVGEYGYQIYSYMTDNELETTCEYAFEGGLLIYK